jgi:imidazolonepropionase-like amidohydrolase
VLRIENVSVFDSDAGFFLDGQTVLIKGDRVTAVAPAGEFPTSSDGSAIDGRGKFLIPGLIDAHVHLTHHLYEAGMTADTIFPNFLRYGVTAVRSTGDSVVAQILLKRISEVHPERAPRLFLASPLVSDTRPIHKDIGWILENPDQVREFVDQMAVWMEITTLKIYANCRREVASELIREGHNQGFRVAGHLHDFSAQEAVAAGIDSIEHVQSISHFLKDDERDPWLFNLKDPGTPELIEKIAAAGTYVTPTLVIFWGYLLFFDQAEALNHTDNGSVPENLRRLWASWTKRLDGKTTNRPIEIRREILERYLELTAMLHLGGVPLLVGTDTPLPHVPPGASLHQEMEWMVKSGIPAAKVLQAVSVNNAAIVDLAEDFGKIRPGFLADLVLLDANPVEDISNTRKINSVVRAGRLVDMAKIRNPPGERIGMAPNWV